MHTNTNRPVLGATFMWHGQLATIIAIHPAGTLDIELADGRCYRLTGLSF